MTLYAQNFSQHSCMAGAGMRMSAATASCYSGAVRITHLCCCCSTTMNQLALLSGTQRNVAMDEIWM